MAGPPRCSVAQGPPVPGRGPHGCQRLGGKRSRLILASFRAPRDSFHRPPDTFVIGGVVVACRLVGGGQGGSVEADGGYREVALLGQVGGHQWGARRQGEFTPCLEPSLEGTPRGGYILRVLSEVLWSRDWPNLWTSAPVGDFPPGSGGLAGESSAGPFSSSLTGSITGIITHAGQRPQQANVTPGGRTPDASPSTKKGPESALRGPHFPAKARSGRRQPWRSARSTTTSLAPGVRHPAPTSVSPPAGAFQCT